MNVFVVGTGRCGTVTFTRACQHMTNYSAAHEQRKGLQLLEFDYPPNHIAVDPHLSWVLALLIDAHPDAFYVHLTRNRAAAANSFFRRGRAQTRGIAPIMNSALHMNCYGLSDDEYLAVCGAFHDVVNAMVRRQLRGTRHWTLSIDEPRVKFEQFWDMIGAEGDRGAALAEFKVRHNAGLWRDDDD